MADSTSGESKQKILILGGGFGGLYAALELEKLLGRRQDVSVTLVNRENFFLFTPMLHEVAASDDDGSTIAAQTLIWTAGNGPNLLLANLPCAMHKGRVRANEFLQVLEWPGVWALGDAAMIPDGKGGFYPPTAQHALREGKTIARNIVASLNGEKLKPFRFKALGQLAAIGQRSGVANVLGLRFSGFVAWSGALWADGA